MTRAKIAVAGVVTLVGGGLLVAAAFMLATKALGAEPKPAATICGTTHNEYIVAIHNDQLSINDIHAQLCDKLTIVNTDRTLRLIAFGEHDNHQPYDGITERVLSQGQSLSVTLNQAGSFTFHDHIHDDVKGTFTVSG